MSGISAISYIENFGRRAISYLVGDDEPVGLAGCTHQPQTREDRLLINEALDEVDLNASPTRTYSCPDDTRAEVVVAAPLAASAAPPGGSLSGALITWTPTLEQELDSHDSANWEMASRSNGNPFNNTWQPHNVTFNNGIMVLRLDNEGCPAGCDSQPYASGEYRTRQETFGHGYYEVRMRATSGSGLLSSFFIYRGTAGQPSHDEIDFEFLGRECDRVQTNYYVEGQGHHEQMINLGFNACVEFHNYGFEWRDDTLIWYVDGREVRRVNEDPATAAHEIPYRAGKIMVNLWPGTGVDSWLGPFSYPGQSLEAQYDWIRFAPLNTRP